MDTIPQGDVKIKSCPNCAAELGRTTVMPFFALQNMHKPLDWLVPTETVVEDYEVVINVTQYKQYQFKRSPLEFTALDLVTVFDFPARIPPPCRLSDHEIITPNATTVRQKLERFVNYRHHPLVYNAVFFATLQYMLVVGRNPEIKLPSLVPAPATPNLTGLQLTTTPSATSSPTYSPGPVIQQYNMTTPIAVPSPRPLPQLFTRGSNGRII